MIPIKRIATSFSIIALVVCCAAMLLLNWSALGWKTLAVPTGSMRPTIPPGSLVFMHRVPTSTLRVGDVITYINPLNPKLTISHRIVKSYLIAGSSVRAFVTKGDANKSDDIPITDGSVLGKVEWHVPYVGNWLLIAKKPIVILPIIYIAAVLLMAEEVQRLAAYLKSLQPYRVAGLRYRQKAASGRSRVLTTAIYLCVAFVIGSAFLWQPALALLRSNTVVLTNNRLSVAPKGQQCSGNNTNNITANNSSSQSGSSGNSTVQGNTTGGSASSGNVNNSNSTTTTIDINNC